MYNTNVSLCRKDKKMYVACYKELAETLPGSPTALLLGDAYMNIQEVRTMSSCKFNDNEIENITTFTTA